MDQLYDEKSLLKEYTQKSCEFMCMIRNLTSLQPCIPWDIPDIIGNKTICHGRRTLTFFTALDAYNPSQDCNCPPECEKINFKFDTTLIPFNWVKDCGKLTGGGTTYPDTPYAREVLKTILERSRELTSWQIRGFVEHMRGGTIKDQYVKTWHYGRFTEMRNLTGICNELASQNNAQIVMYIKESTMIQLIKDVPLSFADKLGIFGGTIGVFTGISFITMIELVYWASVAIIDKCSKKLPREGPMRR